MTKVNKISYGKEIISNLNMNVKQGEIYGFLGPNGAGKTTTMRMITNLIQPTDGTIELFGQRLKPTSYESLKRMGSVIEYPILFENLTAYENVALHCEYMGFYDTKAIQEALEWTGLTDAKEKPVKYFSLGMKQRLGIARAISTKPELLILDEPTNGLDPVGIQELRDFFRKLNREFGITILISSHILQEIDHLSDTIGVIQNGKMIKEVSMSEVRSQLRNYIEVVVTNSKKASFILETKMNITNFKVMDSSAIRIYHPGVSTIDVSKELIDNDIGLVSLIKKELSLEEFFLETIDKGGVPPVSSHSIGI
jgi:ABC-2 type transport system ATP-binding protein